MKVVSQENLAYVIEKLKSTGTFKTPVINNLTSTNTTSALSAYQGKVLNDGKVDKVSGKGLSTNDFTSAEKTKLAGIAEGANKYVLPVSSTTAIGGVKTGRDIKIDADNYAFLDWRTVSTSGNVPILEGAYIDDLHHNKMAFLKAENIKVEYSTDDGATWQDYGLSDEQKVKLVTTEASASIGAKTTGVTIKDKLRVTITAAQAQLYTSSRKVLLNISTNGATGCKVTFDTKIIDDYNNNKDTWTTRGTYEVSGWSGWNSIPFSMSFGGSSGQTTQVRQLRMTFAITAINANYNCNLSLLGIRLIGVTNWSMPSNMAKNGHLYNFDYLQNATFPAQVRTSLAPVGATDLTNKAYVDAQKFSGKYSDLTGKPTIPTKVSQLTNDSGYITSSSSITGNAATASSAAKLTTARNINGVAFNGTSDITITANPTSTKLTNTDLDTILEPGLYHGAGGNTCTNKPSGADAFGLWVYKTADGYRTQEFTNGNNNALTKYIRQYTGSSWGTWTQIKYTDTTYSSATTSAAGLMSASDKTKLDGIATGANKITVDSALSSTSTNPVQNKVIKKYIDDNTSTSESIPEGSIIEYDGETVPPGYEQVPSTIDFTDIKTYLNQLSKNPVGEYILWQGNYFGVENGSYHTLGIRYSFLGGIESKFPYKSGFTRKYRLCMEYTNTNINNEKMYLSFADYDGTELNSYAFGNIWGSTDDGIRSLGIIENFNINEIMPANYHIYIKASPYFGSGATFRIYKVYLLVYDELNLE